MLKLVLLTVIFIVVCVEYSNACSCFPAHPQVKFCRADYAIKGQILREDLIWKPGHNIKNDPARNFAEYRYKVKVLYNFKTSRACSYYTYIYTAGNGGLCGRRLAPGSTEWLFTGNISKGKKRIGLCDWLSDYVTLTAFQKKSLVQGSYKSYCKCVTNGQLKCRSPKNTRNWSCYFQYAICKPCGGNLCSWHKQLYKCSGEPDSKE